MSLLCVRGEQQDCRPRAAIEYFWVKKTPKEGWGMAKNSDPIKSDVKTFAAQTICRQKTYELIQHVKSSRFKILGGNALPLKLSGKRFAQQKYTSPKLGPASSKTFPELTKKKKKHEPRDQNSPLWQQVKTLPVKQRKEITHHTPGKLSPDSFCRTEIRDNYRGENLGQPGPLTSQKN